MPLNSSAEPAHEINDQADHQKEANATATDHRTAKVKAAAAEQQ